MISPTELPLSAVMQRPKCSLPSPTAMRRCDSPSQAMSLRRPERMAYSPWVVSMESGSQTRRTPLATLRPLGAKRATVVGALWPVNSLQSAGSSMERTKMDLPAWATRLGRQRRGRRGARGSRRMRCAGPWRRPRAGWAGPWPWRGLRRARGSGRWTGTPWRFAAVGRQGGLAMGSRQGAQGKGGGPPPQSPGVTCVAVHHATWRDDVPGT